MFPHILFYWLTFPLKATRGHDKNKLGLRSVIDTAEFYALAKPLNLLNNILRIGGICTPRLSPPS